MVDKLLEFCKLNQIEFKNGYRNSPAVTLVGYGLHIGASKEDVLAVSKQLYPKDTKTADELERVYMYGSANGYGRYWENPENVKAFQFPA